MKAPRHRFRRRLLWTLGVLLGLTGGAFLLRKPLLTALAHAWVVDDIPAQADAILVLGGGVQTRPIAAAQLFKEGWAPQVITMTTEPNPTDTRGLTYSETDLTRKALLAEGVPGSAIITLTNVVWSTYDEACAVRQWATNAGMKRLLIPTDLFHTRRARWIFRKAFRGLGVEIRMHAIPQRRYGATNWWQVEEGLVDFQNEVVKRVYYELRY